MGTLHLASDPTSSPVQEELLKTATDCSQTLASIVGNVLDASKISAGKIELNEKTCDIAAVISRCISIYGSACRMKGIAFSIVRTGL